MTAARRNEPTLSEEQSEVVSSSADALLVVASAGSGKTEVVARRVERLLGDSETVDSRILALTYTVKAADELRDRLNARLGALARRVESDTLHGFSHSLVRTYGTRIGLPVEPELLTRDEDRVEHLREWYDAQGLNSPADPRETFRLLDLARARAEEDEMVEIWAEALASASALDYPALLTAASDLLAMPAVRRQVRRLYSAVVVDEAQNLTQAQYDLIKALVQGDEGVAIKTMLVGDDKQSIVSFAGADPRLLERFRADFHAQKVLLTRNFRSAQALSDGANRIAHRLGHEVPTRSAFAAPGKLMARQYPDEAAEGNGVFSWISQLLAEGLPTDALGPAESAVIRPDDIAVLARSAAALRHVAKVLQRSEVPYALASTPEEWFSTTPGRIIYEIIGIHTDPSHRSTYRAIRRLLGDSSPALANADQVRSVLAGRDDGIVAQLVRLLDLTNVDELLPALRELENSANADGTLLAAWQADLDHFEHAWRTFDQSADRAAVTWGNFKMHCARLQRGDAFAPGVRLLTVHKAQGQEFAAVAVVGLNDGQFPDFRATTPEALTSELRTFYVAITRARRVLMLTRSERRETRYGQRLTEPSPFVRYTISD